MKKLVLLFTAIFPAFLFGQFNVVGWDFSGDPPSLMPTEWINPDNAEMELSSVGTSDIQFKNGYEDKAAQATDWNEGANEKCWQVSFNVSEFADIHISSRQQSGGEDPGPRDWKLQYRIGETGAWMDVPGSDYQVFNEWETSFIDELKLPDECNFQELVSVRWIITSDTNSVGGITEATGKSKIDNILVTAYGIDGIGDDEISGATLVWPNPARHSFHIDPKFQGMKFQLVDMTGRVWRSGILSGDATLGVASLPEGYYILAIHDGRKLWTAKVSVKRDC